MVKAVRARRFCGWTQGRTRRRECLEKSEWFNKQAVGCVGPGGRSQEPPVLREWRSLRCQSGQVGCPPPMPLPHRCLSHGAAVIVNTSALHCFILNGPKSACSVQGCPCWTHEVPQLWGAALPRSPSDTSLCQGPPGPTSVRAAPELEGMLLCEVAGYGLTSRPVSPSMVKALQPAPTSGLRLHLHPVGRGQGWRCGPPNVSLPFSLQTSPSLLLTGWCLKHIASWVHT